ncbi:hypothetical protein AB0O75_25555 [Streptomyces sp. NPDC088921]|uniref:hypothetical protein n=1 Tax=unclassified Streptomyces TaxID=2593676 RepID=UPI0034152989
MPRTGAGRDLLGVAFVVPMPGPKPLLGPLVGKGPDTGRPVPDEIVDGVLRAEGSRALIAEDRPQRHVSASREFTAGN